MKKYLTVLLIAFLLAGCQSDVQGNDSGEEENKSGKGIRKTAVSNLPAWLEVVHAQKFSYSGDDSGVDTYVTTYVGKSKVDSCYYSIALTNNGDTDIEQMSCPE